MLRFLHFFFFLATTKRFIEIHKNYRFIYFLEVINIFLDLLSFFAFLFGGLFLGKISISDCFYPLF